MRVAIVQCPKCGAYRLAKVSFKKISCFRCHASISPQRIVKICNSREEAVRALAQLRQRRKNRLFYHSSSKETQHF